MGGVYLVVETKQGQLMLDIANSYGEMCEFIEGIGAAIIGMTLRVKGFSDLIIDNVTLDVDIYIFCS